MTENTTTPNQADVVKALRNAKWVMLTVAREDGKLLSHPMTPKGVSDEADAYFFLALDSGQADVVKQGGNVNLSISETGNWLSVAGHSELIEDPTKLQELWSDADAKYFSGPEDPNLGLLRVTTDSAQYWGLGGGSKVSAFIELAKQKLPVGAAKAADRVTEFAHQAEQKYPQAKAIATKVAQAAETAKSKLPTEARTQEGQPNGNTGTTEL